MIDEDCFFYACMHMDIYSRGYDKKASEMGLEPTTLRLEV